MDLSSADTAACTRFYTVQITSERFHSLHQSRDDASRACRIVSVCQRKNPCILAISVLGHRTSLGTNCQANECMAIL
jgi:hypothetical protein